jgi:hypothetical protein
VAQHRERVGILAVARGQNLDALAVFQRQAQVLDLTVRTEEDGIAGEPLADGPRGVESRRALGQLELRVVR